MTTDDNPKMPDHTLVNADIQPKDEPPQVFAVADLRTFVKPELDEELRGSNPGKSATYGQTICTCVPFETCVCNTVAYHSGGTSDPVSTGCGIHSCMPYYFPY